MPFQITVEAEKPTRDELTPVDLREAFGDAIDDLAERARLHVVEAMQRSPRILAGSNSYRLESPVRNEKSDRSREQGNLNQALETDNQVEGKPIRRAGPCFVYPEMPAGISRLKPEVGGEDGGVDQGEPSE